MTALVSILRCDRCGKLAVSIDGTRVTSHKCAGAWATIMAEPVDVALLRRTVAESAPVSIADVTLDFINGALRRCVGNKTRAASELEIDRRTLNRTLERYAAGKRRYRPQGGDRS